VINKYSTGKHFEVTITETTLTIARRQDQIAAEAALDGFYVLRTPVPASQLPAAGVVTAYKNLKHVERDFRHIKSDDLDLRPVFHRLEERVKAHVLICMLACYLAWHLRQAWAPLTLPTSTRPPPPTRSSPLSAHPTPRPKPPASTTKPGAPITASAACSTTWPPSPATTSGSLKPPPPSPCSPSPPAPTSAGVSRTTSRYRMPVTCSPGGGPGCRAAGHRATADAATIRCLTHGHGGYRLVT
jgi:hypothetical protein